MSVPDITAPFWCRDVGDVSRSLGSGPKGSRRRARPSGWPSWARTASRTRSVSVRCACSGGRSRNPLVLILIFAAAVSFSLAQWVDTGIILAIVIGSSLLGFYQEYRASAAVEELKKRLALTCRVVRHGVEGTVHADTLVPGDVLVLSAGNLIPGRRTDSRGEGLSRQRGEHDRRVVPCGKAAGGRARRCAARQAHERRVSRRLRAQRHGASVVVETGRRTEFGAIAARLRARQPETSFARGLRQFGYLLIRVMIVIVLFVLTVNLLLHRPLVESLLFAVALAVGLSPELLPAIVSVTLSAGARAMGKQGVIVRRLDAIENLGSMTVCAPTRPAH